MFIVNRPSPLASIFVRVVRWQISSLEWKLERRIVVNLPSSSASIVVDHPSPSALIFIDRPFYLASIFADRPFSSASIVVDNPPFSAVHRSSQAPGSDTN
ncbi:hypothetical protein M5K25_008980 [Dendrobium thyrsiflorum]|uniref:Uncharacterized protein n=1 Tax=Dendrobium thyrsiflorum TaxID=117978 RepID=A0ABD0VGV0_DENTH